MTAVEGQRLIELHQDVFARELPQQRVEAHELADAPGQEEGNAEPQEHQSTP